MGLFRLLLAAAVVIGHAVGPGAWTLAGPLAVQMFFVISGFYMAMILETKYLALDRGVTRFYLNRGLRLLPTYWAIALAFIIAATLLGKTVPWPGSWLVAISDVTLIGQDLIAFLEHDILIAPAWSIGMEIWFYLCAPWLVRWPTRWLIAAIAIGVCVNIAIVSAGFPFFPWRQRMPATEFIYFLFGILAWRYKWAPWSGRAALLALLPIVALGGLATPQDPFIFPTSFACA